MASVFTGAVLFVRSRANLDGAVRAVNALLSHRPRAGDDLVGIVIDTSLDERIPPRDPLAASHATELITLRESAGLGGIWSLCWFNLEASDAPGEMRARRCALLDHLLSEMPANRADSEQRRALVPVLTPDEAVSDPESIVAELHTRYPMLEVGARRYVHDHVRGGIARWTPP